jgi:hypothetical protein
VVGSTTHGKPASIDRGSLRDPRPPATHGKPASIDRGSLRDPRPPGDADNATTGRGFEADATTGRGYVIRSSKMNVPVKELLEKAVKGAHERKRPSERNLRIADEVRVGGRTQSEVAADFGISQRRVSQICRQVEQWFASPGWLRGETCGQDEERAMEELTRRQLAEIYGRAMRAYARSERVLVTRRNGERKEGERWSETSEREQRLDTGSLRVALRAIEQRARIDKRSTPMYSPTEQGQVQYLQWAIGALAALRQTAEINGAVPRGPLDAQLVVEQMVRELLGGGTREQEQEQTAAGITTEEQATAEGSIAEDAEPEGKGEERFSSTEAFGAEGASAEGGDDRAACELPVATDSLETSCDDEADVCFDEEPLESPAENSAFSRGEGESRLEADLPAAATNRSSEPTLAERRERARAKVEYCYGMAIDDERLGAELKLLAQWERGDFLACEQSRDLREALLEYRRLLGSRERVHPRVMRPVRGTGNCAGPRERAGPPSRFVLQPMPSAKS